jgi:hypothetical protein
MIRNLVLETQSAKPSIRQVQMHFVAQPSFRADPEAVPDQQHPDHQLRVH